GAVAGRGWPHPGRGPATCGRPSGWPRGRTRSTSRPRRPWRSTSGPAGRSASDASAAFGPEPRHGVRTAAHGVTDRAGEPAQRAADRPGRGEREPLVVVVLVGRRRAGTRRRRGFGLAQIGGVELGAPRRPHHVDR